MPRQIALIICLLFVAYLFSTELRRSDRGSLALWIPLAWMFLAGSRWVSSWLNLGVPLASADDYAEGSPVDRAVFLCLIVMGTLVLANRKVRWATLLSDNKWIALYFAYCFISIAWSDDPFVLFKRWVKDLGNPVMALIILTERRPYEAIGTVLRRLAFLLLPFSVLFIRFFPELGRTYRPDGSPMYTGVGHQKNDLGLMCLVTGIYFFWRILQKEGKPRGVRWGLGVHEWLVIGMLGYLLYLSNSQTALACLMVAVAILAVSRVPAFERQPASLVPFVVLASIGLFLLDLAVGFKQTAFALLGRDPTLTNRTELWDLLRGMAVDPLFGAGFMSFWSGERMEHVWQKLGAGINQAHSGYLEQYLNLGYVGLAFLAAIIVSALQSIRRQLRSDRAGAMLRFCFVATAILYNYTEASFYGMNNMWILFLLGCLDMSRQPAARQGEKPGEREHERQGQGMLQPLSESGRR